jgi:transcriptional regulator with XRE-family HTH domain
MFAILPMGLKRAMAINVRRERHARDWSQEELADRARLSARYLGSREAARLTSPRRMTLKADAARSAKMNRVQRRPPA